MSRYLRGPSRVRRAQASFNQDQHAGYRHEEICSLDWTDLSHQLFGDPKITKSITNHELLLLQQDLDAASRGILARVERDRDPINPLRPIPGKPAPQSAPNPE